MSALWCAAVAAAQPEPSALEAEGRLRVALQIARERNDPALVAEVEGLGRAFKNGLPADADAKLRAVEGKVGVDPGGWSMAGQPLFHGPPELVERVKSLGVKLEAAMKTGDPSLVRAVTAELLATLGAQAGVPDGRRAGRRAEPQPLTEADATRLFLDALAEDKRGIAQIREERPVPEQMVRLYAYALSGATASRPFVARYQPEALGTLDALGITVDALPELLTLVALEPEDTRLRVAAQRMAACLLAKCTDGKRVRLGVQPNQLAAVVQACAALTSGR